MGELERYGFEIDGYEGFQKLLREAPVNLNKALVRGTRRSLGAFRRDFLRQVPLNIRGRGSRPAGRGGGSRSRTVGRSFLWEVIPSSDIGVTARTDVSGVIYTQSRAALGLEVGGTARPDGKALAIPISSPNGDNRSARGGIKPSWKSLKNVLESKRRQYRFLFIKGSQGTVVKAQRRKRGEGGLRSAAFPIFYLTSEIKMEPGRLRYYRTWESFAAQGNIDRRYMAEIDKEITAIARGGRRGRGR